MDALEAFGEDRANAQKKRGLRRPVARRPAAVHLACKDHRRKTRLFVIARSLEDARDLPRFEIARISAITAFGENIGQLDVAETSACHDLVVSSATAVGVEHLGFDSALAQIRRSRAVGGDAARRRNMVRRYEIAHIDQHTRAFYGLHIVKRERHSLEIRSMANIGGVFIPRKNVRRLDLKCLPGVGSFVKAASSLFEKLPGHVSVESTFDFVVGRPDVTQIHRIARLVQAQFLRFEIKVHRACNSIRDNGRGSAQIILGNVWGYAPVEVAVARKRAGKLDIAGDFMHLGPNGARIANAAHAAKTACRKAKFGKRLGKAGAFEQQLGSMASGGHNSLDPRFRFKTRLSSLFRNQTAGKHHLGVGRSRAACDGGDGQRAMRKLERLASKIDNRMMLHIQTAFFADSPESIAGGVRVEAAMRAAWTGKAAPHRRKVKLDDLAVDALGILVPEPLSLGISLDKSDLLFIAARQTQILKRPVIDGEKRARATVLRSHVGNTGSLSRRKRAHAFAEAFDEASYDPFGTKHLRENKRSVHRRNTFGKTTGKMHADDTRNERRNRLSERRCLRLDAANAPRQHTDAVCRRRVAVRSYHRIEIGNLLAILILGHNARCEVLDVNLMTDSRPRRNDAHVLKRFLGPLEKTIALAIAGKLHLHILLKRLRTPCNVGNDRMIDDQVQRNLGIDSRGIAPKIAGRLAHGGKIDENRHAREVLQQDARRHVFDFSALLACKPRAYYATCETSCRIVIRSHAQNVFKQNAQRVRKLVGAVNSANGVIPYGAIAHGKHVNAIVHMQPR